MRRLAIWTVMLGWGWCAGAQDAAVTAATPPPATVAWPVRLGLSLDLVEGNSDTLLLTADLSAEHKQARDEFFLGAKGRYGETDDAKTTQSGDALAQYNRLVSGRSFATLRATAEFDDIADLDYRLMVGPGVGYYLLREDRRNLSLEVGALYREQKQTGESENDVMYRFAESFEWKGAGKTRFWQKAEYIPKATDFDDFLFNAELGVESGLGGRLSLRLLAVDKYASRPGADIERNEMQLKAGLVVDLI